MSYLSGSFFQIISDAISSLTSSVSNKADKSTTINGHALSANVTVSKSDVSLGNADNTSDVNKPVSTATQTALNGKVTTVSGKGLSTEDYTTAEKTKLSGIATGATVNSSDATLLDRVNHTGTQLSSTISDFNSAVDARGGKAVSGTTTKSGYFPVVKSGTISSGTVAFHFTSDGTSGGTALFATGPDQDSVQLSFNDSAASYQPSWAWSNSNKTLTVTLNKLGTANILTGILGQVAAPNGFVVKVIVFGN